MASEHEGRRSSQTGAPARAAVAPAGEERPGALLAYPAREPPATACIVPAEFLSVHPTRQSLVSRGRQRSLGDANG
jgi:hypothetical protein